MRYLELAPKIYRCFLTYSAAVDTCCDMFEESILYYFYIIFRMLRIT